MIEFKEIIVILDERISDEERKKHLETPPRGYRGRKPKVTAGRSDLFPTAMMYLVEVGVSNGKKWLRAYRERGLTAFPYPAPKLLTAVRDKMKRRFQNQG